MGVFERGLEGVTSHLHGAEAKLAPGKISRMPTSQTLFSADGRILAAVNDAGVSFYDTAANTVVREIPAPGTVAIHFSPGGKYLIVYQKANASGAGEGEKNMTVWDVSTGAKVYECFQKAFNKAEWPYIQFSADDSVACRVVTNEAGTHHTTIEMKSFGVS